MLSIWCLERSTLPKPIIAIHFTFRWWCCCWIGQRSPNMAETIWGNSTWWIVSFLLLLLWVMWCPGLNERGCGHLTLWSLSDASCCDEIWGWPVVSFGLGQFGICHRSSPGDVEDSARHPNQKAWKDCGRHRRSSSHFPYGGRFQAFGQDALSKNLACNSICNFSVARWWYYWRWRYGLDGFPGPPPPARNLCTWSYTRSLCGWAKCFLSAPCMCSDWGTAQNPRSWWL